MNGTFRSLARTPLLANLELPLHSTFVHQGRSSDVRIWPASDKPSAVILFICGNPGLIDYYAQFLSTLHKASSTSYEIIGVGHEGHSPSNPLSLLEALNRPSVLKQRPLPTLTEQVQRKIDYVDQIRAEYGNEVKLILMGHSMGAYICQEVLKARPKQVDAIYGLFPTISHIALSPNGVKLAPIFGPSLITLVAAFLSILRLAIPFSWLHLLVRTVTGQTRPSSIVTTQLVTSPATAAAGLSLGSDEMQTIKDLDEDFLRKFGDKITFYFSYGSSDGWVGTSDRVSHITSVLDSTQKQGETRPRWYICDKGMPHAFCIDHSETMAAVCAQWVADALKVEIDSEGA